MVKVLFNNTVLAESDNPVILEGNYYFPPDAVQMARLSNSNTSSVCPWKGYRPYHSTEMDFVFDPSIPSTASYYSADVDGKNVRDIAWYYAQPSASAAHIKNHVAFYKNKVVIED